MYETVLVATDGSDHAERAARHALALADAVDATVHVMSAADVEAAAGPFDAGGVDEEYRERVDSESEAAVEAVASMTDRAVETAVVEGSPADAILEHADETDADVVVMGTRGRTGLRRAVTGSVAEEVVHRAERPVVTVAASDDAESVGDVDRVLVPTDGSDAAVAAVDHGIAVADAFDAAVHALHVVDAVSFGARDAFSDGTSTQLEAVGEQATDSVAQRAREAGLDATAQVRTGSPDTDLLEYVDEAGIDFVAMGTHGRTGIERVLLGSTAERMIRRADVPVLSAHPGSGEPVE